MALLTVAYNDSTRWERLLCSFMLVAMVLRACLPLDRTVATSS
jgi:hypothetical protein